MAGGKSTFFHLPVRWSSNTPFKKFHCQLGKTWSLFSQFTLVFAWGNRSSQSLRTRETDRFPRKAVPAWFCWIAVEVVISLLDNDISSVLVPEHPPHQYIPTQPTPVHSNINFKSTNKKINYWESWTSSYYAIHKLHPSVSLPG